MKKIELIQQPHNVKVGDTCGTIEPNITEDTLFLFEGIPIGFYIRSVEGKAKKLLELANLEFRSERVPKSTMKRSSGVEQYSTVIGSCPPKPHMRRPYPSISSVHKSKTAQTFIKAMIGLCKEGEDILHDIMPEQYFEQQKLIREYTPEKYRFGTCFTSSINNYNIAAPFHRDTGNIQGAVNLIFAKKKNATGGNTTVPDYNATVDSCDNSLLCYPAWRNVHGVTPIIPTSEGGYRNSLVFYPLASFKGHK
jgi:hypothetical protein